MGYYQLITTYLGCMSLGAEEYVHDVFKHSLSYVFRMCFCRKENKTGILQVQMVTCDCVCCHVRYW